MIDIEAIEKGIGNGSITMKYLIETAEKINVSHIEGGLSSIDASNFDKFERYY
ncbi:hypothetical protein [Bacillus cereus group sp. BfR-BA-01524]|uniref:hypothetical protein n=1 Tax=Bacillus cereus group sp. BfR-BA-01524 TaxID=2920372 RepID=UPI001F593A1F